MHVRAWASNISTGRWMCGVFGAINGPLVGLLTLPLETDRTAHPTGRRQPLLWWLLADVHLLN